MKIGKVIITTDIFGNRVMLPAMEADDITDLTKETKGMIRNTVRASNRGEAEPNAATEPTGTTEETHEEDNDDLSASSDDDFSNDPDSVPDPDGSDEGDDGDADMGGDDFGDSMDGSDDDMSSDEQEVDDEGNPIVKPEDARRIDILQSNMFGLYNSAGNLLEVLSDYSIPSSTTELRAIYNSSIGHLTTVKTILESLLGTEFNPKTYSSKLRKFIALRHVYSLTIDQLKSYFDAIDVMNGRTSEKVQ